MRSVRLPHPAAPQKIHVEEQMGVVEPEQREQQYPATQPLTAK
jgi:hypothetical protein